MKTRTAQKDKFEQLLKKSIPPEPDNHWVVNLSSKELSPNKETALKKGMNFAEQIPVNYIPVGVEGGLQGWTGSTVDKAHLKVAGVLMSPEPPPCNLPWSLLKALNDLKKREGIMILPADKGHCMLVMDETEYHAKVDSRSKVLQGP